MAFEARKLGITIAIENHDYFAMTSLICIAELVENTNLDICFDSGNAVRIVDDLHAAAALAGSRIPMVRIKDVVVQESSRGSSDAWLPSAPPLGRGQFDLPRLIGQFCDAGCAGTPYIESILISYGHIPFYIRRASSLLKGRDSSREDQKC